MLVWIKDIAPKVFLRLLVACVVFFIANYFYTNTFYPKERQQFSPVSRKLDSAFLEGDVLYFGESSNTSFNPWTDTLGYSVSDFLQMYLPWHRVSGVSHDGYHVGLFSQMLGLMPDHWTSTKAKPKTIVITVNMRSFGPSAMFNGNEASNQQEAIFYSHRLPLLNRMFVSLHHYDNRDSREMERAKIQWWRTHDLRMAADKIGSEKSPYNFINNNPQYPTAKRWVQDLMVTHINQPEKIRHMAEAYVKEFAFVLNDKNPRVQDFSRIVKKCQSENVNLIFLLLMPNRDHAQQLFGNSLTTYIDYNLNFLRDRMARWEDDCDGSNAIVSFVDLPMLYAEHCKQGRLMAAENGFAMGSHYTDQWYPTEHVDAHVRQFIAKKIADKIAEVDQFHRTVKNISPSPNNWPNWNIKMPLSDTLLQDWQAKKLK